MDTPRIIELLAPAKNAETAIAAIDHGADAVYIGAPKFGARASVGNSIDDIKTVVDYAHKFYARVYVTVNTIIYDSELKDVEQMIAELYLIGVDAIIVQDMGILRMNIPPIQLHASTQCDIRTAEKAKFLEDVGFSQLVLARELTTEEIVEIKHKTTSPIEYFVHGALCVSYSGKCHASCAFIGRSANRGECAQICRLPYDIYDENGLIAKGKHILSLKDNNLSDRMEALLVAGVSSFKIEGRLKEVGYVKNFTAYYYNILNDICRRNPQRYRRRACGATAVSFTPNPEKSFNRGFTHYFNENRRPEGSMANIFSPKSMGEKIGTVVRVNKNIIRLNTKKSLSNGDGFVYLKDGELIGFRANKASGNQIETLKSLNIPQGTTIYRNYDKAFDDTLQKESSVRTISISVALRRTASGISVDIKDEVGNYASIHEQMSIESANKDQTDSQRRVFSKLGNTCYTLADFNNIDTANLFIPASVLTELRRCAVEALERAKRAAYQFEYRKKEDMTVRLECSELNFRENVANRLAETFYKEHGAVSIEPALEVDDNKKNPIVMNTRYCIRRELGACLKTKTAGKIGKDMIIESGDIRMSVEFDCKNCQMILRKL